MNFFKWLFRKKENPVKLGIALGSGGAKGFAEIGALKAFEENDIHFDVVGGTSIGSIVGAFYADGYSPTDIMEMLKKINPGEIANKIFFNMDMSGLEKVIDREIGGKDVEQLKKPFVCVATEVISGEERLFKTGNVAIRLCASSCYPPFFRPVVIDGETLVDGAFTNSVPADHVKALGADYVVGIDLSDHEPKTGILSKIFPTYTGGVSEPWKKGYENSNVMLHPNLKGYRSVSFSKAEEMFDIGYNHALGFIDIIKKDVEALRKKQKSKKREIIKSQKVI